MEHADAFKVKCDGTQTETALGLKKSRQLERAMSNYCIIRRSTFCRHYSGDRNKVDNMGRQCNTCGKEQKHRSFDRVLESKRPL
jgi:hypothetical protein